MKSRMRSATSIERIDFERQIHAARGAELVDQNLRSGMSFDVFEEQRGAAGPDLELLLTRSAISVISRMGSTSVLNCFQFAGALQRRDPLSQIS